MQPSTVLHHLLTCVLVPIYFLLYASCIALAIAFDRRLRRLQPDLAEQVAARRRGLREHLWILRGEFRGALPPVVRLGRVYRGPMSAFYAVFALIAVGFAAAFLVAGAAG